MSILIASDHAGLSLKTFLIKHIDERVIDFGTHNMTSVDYPDFAHDLCRMMSATDYGILICGTGIGMSIVANRYKDIRCAVAIDIQMAQMARQHNDANVVALGARLINDDVALGIVNVFLTTAYDGGRHDRRLAKINR